MELPRSWRKYFEKECEVDSKTGSPIQPQAEGSRHRHRSGSHSTASARIWTPSWKSLDRYKLIVVEDACQAHGAEYFSQKVQSLDEGRLHRPRRLLSASTPGRISAPAAKREPSPPMTRAMMRSMKMQRDHGQAKKYYHDIEGYNGRLDSLQAGLLSVKLRSSGQSWTRERQAAAGRIRSVAFAGVPWASLLRTSPKILAARLSSLRGPCRRSRRPAEASRRPRKSIPAFTIRFLCTCKKRTKVSDTKKAISRSPSELRPRSYLCPCIHNSLMIH